jgi:hypothetical protein
MTTAIAPGVRWAIAAVQFASATTLYADEDGHVHRARESSGFKQQVYTLNVSEFEPSESSQSPAAASGRFENVHLAARHPQQRVAFL